MHIYVCVLDEGVSMCVLIYIYIYIYVHIIYIPVCVVRLSFIYH